MLSNGFATYLLVPLSTAIGRRPVLILTSTFSWAGGFWAGASTSLQSHIAARVFHGLGSGAVEALLPLIVQDFTFLHQRNKALAAIISSQVSLRYSPLAMDARLTRLTMQRARLLSCSVSCRPTWPSTGTGDGSTT